MQRYWVLVKTNTTKVIIIVGVAYNPYAAGSYFGLYKMVPKTLKND